MKYMDRQFSITYNNIGNVPGIHTFRMNSIYDPDYTGVGVQPYYHDTFVPLYDRYKVNAAKITVYISSSTSHKLNYVAIVPSKTSAGPDYEEINDICNVPGAVVKAFSTVPDSRAPLCIIKKYCRLDWFFDNLKDESFTCTFGENPDNAYAAFFHVMAWEGFNAANMTYTFDVKIKYYCNLIRAKEQDES